MRDQRGAFPMRSPASSTIPGAGSNAASLVMKDAASRRSTPDRGTGTSVARVAAREAVIGRRAGQ